MEPSDAGMLGFATYRLITVREGSPTCDQCQQDWLGPPRLKFPPYLGDLSQGPVVIVG